MNFPGQSLTLCVRLKVNLLSAICPDRVPPPPTELVYVPRTELPSCIRVNESVPEDRESAKVATQAPSISTADWLGADEGSDVRYISCRFSHRAFTSLMGIAKFRFCPSLRNAQTTAITSPLSLKTGPPLLPCETGADIWKSFWPSNVRTPLMSPLLMDFSRPSGLPITTTGKPVKALSESPSLTA